jgi:SulP family sulfate permease
VLLRLRGHDELGSTFIQMLLRYARELAAVDSRLVLVSTTKRIEEQAAVAGLVDVIGTDALYRGDERAGATLSRAVDDAQAWVAKRA